jgi:hypothetical protein
VSQVLAGAAGVESDVTAELMEKGYLGYRDMGDVVTSASSFMGNRLNPFKLR